MTEVLILPQITYILSPDAALAHDRVGRDILLRSQTVGLECCVVNEVRHDKPVCSRSPTPGGIRYVVRGEGAIDGGVDVLSNGIM